MAEAVNITADSTATALPKLVGGNNDPDFYMITTSAAMHVVIGTQTEAGNVSTSDTFLPAGAILFLAKGNYTTITHAGKVDV